MKEHADRVAVVTGGTGGIGQAVCAALAAERLSVVAVSASETELREFSTMENVADVEARHLDVTDGDAVRRFFASLDRLDVLVNLAGIGRGLNEFDEVGFAQTIEVNLLGTMRACYGAYPLLSARGGSVVNTASMMSFFGTGTAPAYAASKGGVAQLTKSLAIAWAQDGIRVNAVAPGWITTPMTTALADDEEFSRKILARTPLGRWGTPEDIAHAVHFLVSPRSAFITGVILPVDGGYLIS